MANISLQKVQKRAVLEQNIADKIFTNINTQNSPKNIRKEFIYRINEIIFDTNTEHAAIFDIIKSFFPRLNARRSDLMELVHLKTKNQYKKNLILEGEGETYVNVSLFIQQIKMSITLIKKFPNSKIHVFGDTLKSLENFKFESNIKTQRAPDFYLNIYNDYGTFLDGKFGNIDTRDTNAQFFNIYYKKVII